MKTRKIIMTNFSILMTRYFSEYLSQQRGMSANTKKTYRDVFVQLIIFMQKKKGIREEKLEITDFNFDVINEFLDELETEKHFSVSTRNNRLAAIKSFFRYVSYKDPTYLATCTSILQITKKKSVSKPMNYLTIDTYKDLISHFDMNDKKDLRSLAVISLMYESAARVSEVCNIKMSDFRMYKPYTLLLHGKGNKDRIVPIDATVMKWILAYTEAYDVHDDDYLFFNARREKLTREGINYIIKKHISKARALNPQMYPKTFSAHCLRHTKAMHLLENDVNLVYIRDLLGHSSVTTTEIYSKANPEVKRKHLEKASEKIEVDDYTKEEQSELLEWLKNNI